MYAHPQRPTSLVQVFRTMALLAGVGLWMSSWPIYHEHAIEEGEVHSLHVHAHGNHVHHSHGHHHHHYSDSHCHSDHGTESPEDGESEKSAHLHLLLLDLEVPHTPSCDIPRPLLSCLGILQASPIEAAENLSLRIPGARAPPPDALSDERHLV